MLTAREIDDEVKSEVRRRLKAGAQGCSKCDDTGREAYAVDEFTGDWRTCSCWIGKLLEQAHLQNAKEST